MSVLGNSRSRRSYVGLRARAIALALASERPHWSVTAVDISAAALATARANAASLELNVEFLEGAWFAPLKNRRFHVIASNPPYVAEGDDVPRPKEGTRIKGRIKPVGSKSGLIADRKGRRVLVQRTGSDEARARNEDEANGYGGPRRPTRGYKGKRDLKPQTDFTDD